MVLVALMVQVDLVDPQHLVGKVSLEALVVLVGQVGQVDQVVLGDRVD